MKLPGIDYTQGVRSLGRENPATPVSVASTEAATYTKMAGVLVKSAEAIQANDVASDASKFQTAMSELNASVKSRKSYTTDELDALEIKYDNQYGAGKLEEVPAYLVSKQVYQKLSGKLYKQSSELSSRKGKAVIAKMYGQMYKEGITGVITSSMAEAYSVRSVETEIDFDAAVSSGNAEAATILAETARATGIWDSEKYLAKTKDMPNNIANNQYLNNLNRTDDTVILRNQLEAALVDPRLKPSSKNAIYKNYDSKIKALEKEEAKILDENKKQASYTSFVENSTSILNSNEPMEWGAINTIAMGMEPTDGKALITLNRMMGTRGLVTDPKVHMGLTTRINAISLPRVGTTVHQRRETAVNELMRAAGYDPISGEQVGPSKISPTDFTALWGQINKSQAFVYDNPEVKRMSDFIWSTLTGGSKDMMTRFFGTGPDTMNAVQAEADMHNAARAAGPGFNPAMWWEANGAKYITASIEENEAAMRENRIDKFVVRDLNSPGNINMDKTVKGIRDRVKAGSMSEEDAKRAVEDIYNYQKKRIQQQELIRGTK